MSKELKGANKLTGKKLYGISKQDIIDNVLKVYEENNNSLTREEYLQKGSYSRAPIKRLFGGWNNLLKELGLNINCSRMDATKEEILLDAKSIIKQYGYLDAKLYRTYGKYSQPVVDRLFGSHGKLMRELGLYSGKAGRNISKEEILEGLKELYLKHGMMNSTLIEEEFYISLPTVYVKVGNMMEIYKSLNIEPSMTSKIGNDVIQTISDILNEKPIKEWTCPQLKNPKTGMNLFIDAYFPNANIALEYDGEQHYKFVPHFHGTIEKFKYQQSLDKFKDNTLALMDIKVIRIKFDEPIDIKSLVKRIS